MQVDELLAQDFGTLPDLIRAHALRDPGHTALVLDGRSLSFAQLDGLMDRVAAALQRDGVRPREVIAISASTSLDHAAVFLGSLRAGIAVAPLARDSTPAGLAAMVADSGAKRFFLDQGVAQALADGAQSVAVPRIALDDSAMFDALPACRAATSARC